MPLPILPIHWTEKAFRVSRLLFIEEISIETISPPHRISTIVEESGQERNVYGRAAGSKSARPTLLWCRRRPGFFHVAAAAATPAFIAALPSPTSLSSLSTPSYGAFPSSPSSLSRPLHSRHFEPLVVRFCALLRLGLGFLCRFSFLPLLSYCRVSSRLL